MLLNAIQALKMLKFKFLNPELQLKDTESAIKSKLIELLPQIKGFKFMATLLLLF